MCSAKTEEWEAARLEPEVHFNSWMEHAHVSPYGLDVSFWDVKSTFYRCMFTECVRHMTSARVSGISGLGLKTPVSHQHQVGYC